MGGAEGEPGAGGADELARRLEALSPKQRRLLELRLAREGRAGAGAGESAETSALPAPPPASPASGLDPIRPLPRDGRTFLLSFAQQRLWFLDQLEAGSSWYNMPIALRLRGPLDVAALGAALSELERRHEALRTTFSPAEAADPGDEIEAAGLTEHPAFQVIRDPAGLFPPLADLRGLGDDRREAELFFRIRAEARRPFDLARGPLARALLFQLGEEEHALLFNLHHVVCDGWSLGVLVREMGALYEAARRRALSPLPPLPVQYADFAAWQRRTLAGPELGRLLAYWKERLAGLPPVLELPADRPRPAVQSFRGGTLPVVLPLGTTEAVRALSRRAGATPFMTLLSAFLALLHRITGQDDLAVGTPVANRGRQEIEGLIGFFVNTLVLRGDLAADPTFRALLARVQTVAAGAYAHQDLPFEKLVEEADPERQLSHNPLFQVMFLLQNAPLPELSAAGLTLSPLALRGGTAKFDLSLYFWEAAPELTGYFEYSSDLFDAATVRRLGEQLVTLLGGALAAPERRLSELPLLSFGEREQLLREWNDTAFSLPEEEGLHQLFGAQAARTPDAVALIAPAGSAESGDLTYRALSSRAVRLARRLRELGVGTDVPVAVALRRSPAQMVAVLGTLAAGGVYVPLDPSYPRERLERMLALAKPRVLIAEEDLLATLSADSSGSGDSGDAAPRSVGFTAIGAREIQDLGALEPGDEAAGLGELARPWAGRESLAYVIFTSGSTGEPKGVAMPHRPLLNLMAWQLRNSALGLGGRTLQFASLSFDVSCQELFSTWASGGTLVLIPEELRLDASALLDFLRSAGVARIFLPFVALQQLAETAIERGVFPEGLREVVTAGEQLQITPAVAELFIRLPGTRLYNQYGPSETHVVTAYELQGEASGWPRLPSIGTPVANTWLRILDRTLGPVPVGVPGELYLGGENVARGYLGRPDLTAERFVPDPFGARGERLYRTGDLARWRTDGTVDFLGRTDQQVKIRGFRVEPGEVEAVLAAHPAVREAAVVARQDLGGPARRLVAYVVATGETGTLDLRAWVRSRLPEHMVPSVIRFLPALPLTPSGKVNRRALPAPEAEGVGGEAGGSAASAPPATPMEVALAEIWRKLLNLERVGVGDSFFDLGGHSLLAVRLLARIRRELGRELPLAALFAGPTIRRLAALLEKGEKRGGGEGEGLGEGLLVPLRAEGEGLPLFLVHPVGGSVFCYLDLARHLPPGFPVYGLQHGEGAASAASLEELAGLYLEALREVQPEGPYRLGGWSLGGVVAYEMARQLSERGQEVERLVVIDVEAPLPLGADAEASGRKAPDEATVRAWFARDLAGLRGAGRQAGWESIADAAEAPLQEVFERAVELGLLPPDLDLATALRRFEIFRANLRRLGAYRARPYRGRLDLFRASDSHFQNPSDPTLGWGALAQGGGELHEIPGDHWAILRAPGVGALAARMADLRIE